MATALLAAIAGWLTLAAPPPAEKEAVDTAAWVTRLTGLRDHMHTAFAVGPELTQLDPEVGFDIVKTAWPKIKEVEVKTGLLKTFAFSKALPSKHPKVLQVLDLGMNDKKAKVREYAAAYVEEYSGTNFKANPKAYQAWYKENGDKDPNELLKLAAEKPKVQPEAAADKGDPARKDDAALNALNMEGWKQFFRHDFAAAEKTFRQILKAQPNHAAAMNGLGFCLLNQGHPQEAQPCFEKLLKDDPDAGGPLNGLARCLNDIGKTDEAIKVWEHAYELEPAPNDIAWGLSAAYMKTQQYDKAIPVLELLLKDQPENERLKSQLATAKKESAAK